MTEATNPTLTAALGYVARGWSVLPLKAQSKVPATANGKKDASLDPDQVQAWFSRGREQNVGILTGVQSRLLVVDIDPRNGGDFSLARLEEAYGRLPETLRAVTGGGGAHYFYTLPASVNGMRDRPNVAGYSGVDLKIDGYVVAAPSIHPDTGEVYRWGNQADVVEAPAWLVELAKQSPPRVEGGTASSAGCIVKGTRNNSVFRFACSLRGKGASEEEIRNAVVEFNATSVLPPLDSAELERVVQSSMRYEVGSDHADSDVGNARRLVDLIRGNARYEPRSRFWFVWNGSHWSRDEDGQLVRFAKFVVDQLLIEARSIPDPDTSKRRMSFALRSQAVTRINAMIELAKSEPGVPIKFEDFDNLPFILNCANGMVDLRSGALMPHDREALISQIINISFLPDAECPTFAGFLQSILSNEQDLIDYVHQAIGYSATGETREQSLFLLHGDGANGKSTFLNVIRSVLGGYAKHTPTDTLISRSGSASNDLARLAGTRFVTASEANADQKIADALLKQITGDEPVTARFLFKEFVTFQPQFKLFLATNQLPKINGSDPAMWRRIRTIPFTRVFKPEDQDRDLGAKLETESEGVLAWIVRGAVKWYSAGLVTPSAVEQANLEYRTEMDSVGQFIEEMCFQSSDAMNSASELYTRYRMYANDNGRDEVNATVFGRTLTSRGFPVIKRGGTKFRLGLTTNRQGGQS